MKRVRMRKRLEKKIAGSNVLPAAIYINDIGSSRIYTPLHIL